jgi:hypothetical protein
MQAPMKLNPRFVFIFAFLMIALSDFKLQAQEIEENPLDTLTRYVGGLADDVLKLKRLKITGYLQAQYQYCQTEGASSFAGGDFVNGSNKYYSRFMMRRGRIKFTYEDDFVTFVMQPDISEKGIFMRETYIKLTDPWLNIASAYGGLIQVPFGFELVQSSQVRETPERARFNQILFPVERDLGFFVALTLPKFSPLYGLKLDLGVMNGSAGVASEFDSHKDFVERLSFSRTNFDETFSFNVGLSNYHGGYRIGKVKDYNFNTLSNGDHKFEFATDTSNYNRVARRNYQGADAQLTFELNPFGITTLRAEYIQGEQPGTDKLSKSLGAAPSSSVYHRKFNGAYFYFVQNIGTTHFQFVAKYDWYDPNSQIAGTEIGKAGTSTNIGDIRHDTFGIGLTYRINSYVKLTGYYDFVKNENTLVSGYEKDIDDNVTTVRLQYRF